MGRLTALVDFSTKSFNSIEADHIASDPTVDGKSNGLVTVKRVHKRGTVQLVSAGAVVQ